MKNERESRYGEADSCAPPCYCQSIKNDLGEVTLLIAPGASLGSGQAFFYVSLGEAALCLRQNVASPRLLCPVGGGCPQACAQCS